MAALKGAAREHEGARGSKKEHAGIYLSWCRLLGGAQQVKA